MPTSPFHNKGDARLMQDILTYSPTQPDAQAKADATRNEGATSESVVAYRTRLLREAEASGADQNTLDWRRAALHDAEVEAHNAKVGGA